jgi:hypothetical protein
MIFLRLDIVNNIQYNVLTLIDDAYIGLYSRI